MKKSSSSKFPPISDMVRWKDHHFLVMDKKAGMTVQPDQTEDMSLLQLGQIYSKHTLHLVTRLDRPVGGLVLFGKSPEDVSYLKGVMESNQMVKNYVAIVEGTVEQKEGKLKQFLFHNKTLRKAEISNEEKEGFKSCTLEYKLLTTTDNYSILKIKIGTGRFHQIRAQLSEMGHSIKGDVKYGAKRGNEDRSIHLYCYEMSFKNKAKNKNIECFAELPTEDKLWALTKEILDGEK